MTLRLKTMKPNVKAFVELCLDQAGEPYVFGAEVNQDGSLKGTQKWDCSELTSVAAHQTGGYLPDGSMAQLDHCRSHETTLPVDHAVKIYGALLFVQTSTHHHVAVSLGNGKTIEARGRAYGVGSWSVEGRGWTHAGLIPSFEYAQEVPMTPEQAKMLQEIWNAVYEKRGGKLVEATDILEAKLDAILKKLS